MAKLRLVEGDDSVERLRDVRVPAKFFDRMCLSPALDELFGGPDNPGVLRGSTTFITGSPGAGKSTMCLQFADMLQTSGARVLFNIGEENRYMVKMRADRLSIRADYHVSQLETADELVAFVLERRFDVVFQDSLQTLRDPPNRGRYGLVSSAGKMQLLSKQRDVTAFIIGQCTKGGTFAGPNEIAHDLDGHLHLSLDGNARRLQFNKNRNGPSGTSFNVELKATGMEFKPAPEGAAPGPSSGGGSAVWSSGSSQAQGKRRGADRRRDVLAVAKDQLLSGGLVSGYCYERLGLDCSGGFWRAMVATACAELRREGYGVGERKVSGRAHFFIDAWKKA